MTTAGDTTPDDPSDGSWEEDVVEVSPLVAGRRARVLDDVQPLLAREGVEVTMDDLADAAGIGRRTLFRYFESRGNLIAAAVGRSFDSPPKMATFPPCTSMLWSVATRRKENAGFGWLSKRAISRPCATTDWNATILTKENAG